MELCSREVPIGVLIQSGFQKTLRINWCRVSLNMKLMMSLCTLGNTLQSIEMPGLFARATKTKSVDLTARPQITKFLPDNKLCSLCSNNRTWSMVFQHSKLTTTTSIKSRETYPLSWLICWTPSLCPISLDVNFPSNKLFKFLRVSFRPLNRLSMLSLWYLRNTQ